MMQRAWLIAFVSAMNLLAALIASASVWQASSEDLRGVVDATQTFPLPYRQPLLGVNADLRQYDAARLDKHLQMMADSGITWVRQFVDWSEVEAEEGVYRWEVYDPIFAALERYPGLRPVAVLVGAPGWARRSEHPSAPPHAPTTLAAFARVFAQRYGHLVHHYQIWDEPNLRAAWGDADPSPAHYAAILQASAQALRSADPSAFILAAALAPTTEQGPRNLNEWDYLHELYRLGAHAWFDAAAAKPYGFSSSPLDRLIDHDTLNFSRVVVLREIMESYGDHAKGLWASAWGWNSLAESWTGEPSIWGSVSAEDRQRYSLEALSRAGREWPWMGAMIAQHWQPAVPLDNPQWGFALLTPDDQPTPLLQALTAHLPYIPQDGLYHPTHPNARYSGVWTFGPLGADIGWLETSDSRAQFDFVGRDLALLLRRGDYVAFLYPQIRGYSPNALPKDNAGHPYLILQSADLTTQTELVAVARQLPLQEHQLSLVADRGWDRWALAGFAVSSGSLALPYEQTQTAMAIWLALACVAFLFSLARLPYPHKAAARLKHLLDSLGLLGQIIFSGLASVLLMLAMWTTWGDAVPAILKRENTQYALGLLLSGGLIALEQSFALLVLCLILLFVLIYHRLELGLLLTLFWAPFFLFPVELYRFAFPMAELLLLLTAAAWVTHGAVTWAMQRRSNPTQILFSRWPRSSQPLDVLMVAWVAIALLSLFWTSRLDLALTDLRTLILEPALLYAMIRSTANQQTVKRLAWALMASAWMVSVIGLALFVQGQAVINTVEGAGRLASVYGSPNNVALLLGRVLPFVAAYAMLNPRWRWAMALFAAPMGLALLLTQSVGGLALGLPVGLLAVLMAAQGFRHAWKPSLALILLAIVGIGLLSQLSPRFTNLFDPARGTNFIRLRVWESSLNMLAEQPLTGLGMDQFLYAYRERYIRPDAIADKDLSHPHNMILDHWLRLGLPGLVWLGVVMVVLGRAAWQRARTESDADRWVAVGVFGAWAAVLAHGMIDNSLYVQDLALIFAFLAAGAARPPTAQA